MDEKEQKRLAEEQELERKLEEFDRKATPSYLRKRYKLALAKRIEAGEVGLIEEIKKLDALEATPDAVSPASSPQPASPVASGKAGASSQREILDRLRIRPRAYTMSEAALVQRKIAATRAEKAKSMLGNRNACKTGEHAHGLVRQLFRPASPPAPSIPAN